MKRRMKQVLCTTVSTLTLAAAVGGAASAATVSDKCGGKNIAVANVETDLLIRESASGDSKVIGFVPGAAGVIVRSMDADWTLVESGNISGYVKTEYLAFGDTAEQLKSIYGVLGAVANYDGVKVFSDNENLSSVIGTLNEGEGYEVLGSTANWVEVELADGSMGYVAAEDVEMTTVLDTAIATDAYVAPAQTESTQNAPQTAPVQTETVPETESYADDSYAAAEDYTETESYVDYGTVNYMETEAYAETESYPETESYAEDVDYGTVNYVETEGYVETEAYVETESYVETEDYSTTDYTEAEVQTEAWSDEGAYADDTYVEGDEETGVWDEGEDDGLGGDEYIDPSTEADGSTDTSYSASDLDLLAALIYCEAGNQSEEGKIAVGQVVMNRVNSSSLADSISGVIYESGQFTPASSGWLDQVIGNAPQDCYDAAAAALNGEGTVGDALYFNAGSGQGQQIGDHQFY